MDMAGNMREVYVDTQASIDHINRMRDKTGPYDAEAYGGVTPSWHIITTKPNAEGHAVTHLIARRFGVYLPQITNTVVIRGKAREVSRNMFPGYLFVFAWDIGQHERRIMACPGVASIMTVDGKYVTVSDQLIDRIRETENANNPLDLLPRDIAVAPKKMKKKKWKQKRYPRKVAIPAQANVTVQVSAKSYWRDVSDMDADERIGLLRYELGLAM